MKTIWNKEKIEKLLIDFYNITHIRVGLFDLDGQELTGYPQELAFYCQKIRSTTQGLLACKNCDMKAYLEASSLKEIHIYRCHAGLIEMIVPIQRQGRILGYLMMGQFRTEEVNKDKQKKLTDYWRKLGMNVECMTSHYYEIVAVEKSLLNAYAHILQACAAYVWMDDYIRILHEPLGRKIEHYIINHLDEKITIAHLMEVFYVGKTSICEAVKAETGFTVLELLRNARIEKAKELLQSDAMPISEVASKVGIEDYNYFSKFFRQETGVTPSAYRKQSKKLIETETIE